MDASLRNTRDLTNRLDKLQADLIKKFHSIVDLAAITKRDRSVTAVVQYQMQTETAALIRTAEDVQTLIRQLQEMWLFGQLDTRGESQTKQKTDEDAKVVAQLLERYLETMGGAARDGDGKDGMAD